MTRTRFSAGRGRARGRILRALALGLALCGATAERGSAHGRDIEIDVREGVSYFEVPSGALGPFNVVKFDATVSDARDLLVLHAVTTNRLATPGVAHGEFARVEDDHRFGASLVRSAFGVGSGALASRSATLAVVQSLTRDRRLALSAAIDVTSLSRSSYQRVLGLGTEIHIGRVAFTTRFYHASTSDGATAPSSAAVGGSFPLARRIACSLVANFGGELNADRTSGFLPTSSGRFGSDISASLRARLGGTVGILAGYDGAVYRAAPTGAPARVQHLITFGVVVASDVAH